MNCILILYLFIVFKKLHTSTIYFLFYMLSSLYYLMSIRLFSFVYCEKGFTSETRCEFMI